MSYYRKKPVIVEAHQWFPQPAPKPPVVDELGKILENGKPRLKERYGVRFCPANKQDLSATRGIIVDRPARYVIDTLEGPMEVQPGCWIVTGVKGERYAVRDDIFRLTYEPATMMVKSARWFLRWFQRGQNAYNQATD